MDVNLEVDVLPNRRRKKGQGRIQKKMQKRRSGGKTFVNTKKIEVQAREKPSATVCCLILEILLVY